MARFAPWILVLALAVGIGLALVGKPAEPPAHPAEPVAAAPEPGDPEDPVDPMDILQGAPSAAPQAMSGDEVTLTGVVREHMDVPQYTYLHLTTDKGEAWAAVYRGPIKDGAKVTVEHAVRLEGFHSKELNRDFPVIYFGMLPGVTSAPPEAEATAGSPTAPAGSVAPPAIRPKGSLKIADLATRAVALKGQQVTIAGRVVKETDGVLDRNWIHVKDGSGDAKAGSDDVLVTTDGTSKVGDDVVVTGTVNTDQDYGSGYAYKFLLEHATVRPATSM